MSPNRIRLSLNGFAEQLIGCVDAVQDLLWRNDHAVAFRLAPHESFDKLVAKRCNPWGLLRQLLLDLHKHPDEMRRRFDGSVSAVQHEADKWARVANRASPLMETLGGLAICLAIIYSGYLITHIAFLIAHPNWWNLIIVVTADTALVARALIEERVLGGDVAYRAYCQRVGWHLVPGVF